MSKNVAVFVDVANIFYAAKAAGVDIDYVTLLKSATAGRDLVRAYAYTGLDPENENQRQFHGFLARSGFKVVSKDIRKYGDGRVKANLDIELVVDLMRMAEKLDVAVVVSGDGDFAPAITAVQQQGVRVEVISFRGNTSSDLIDVADVFIDIGSVAKVEKGVRSGRRVAAEGDLSMTEVPDKESGVTPRRRRRDGDERPERAIRTGRRRGSPEPAARDAEPVAHDGPRLGAITALPGEKLSRGAALPPAAVLPPLGAPPPAGAPVPAADAESEAGVESDLSDEQRQEEGRRRRRRRGGRGRGRGGRAHEGAEVGATPEDEVEADLPEFADEVAPLPQHAGFGSVWDSQIGLPGQRRAAPPVPPGEAAFDDEELDEAEPEVPEYLLAERRQQDRHRAGRGGRGGGYRTALDRERFGTGARSGFQRGPSRPPRGARPVGQPRASARSMEPIEQTPGGDPWSEVPPEVQELLRAELARRQPAPAPARPPAPRPASSGQQRGSRGTRPPAEDAEIAEESRQESRPATVLASAPAEAPAAPSEEARPKRTTRKRAASGPAAPAAVSTPGRTTSSEGSTPASIPTEEPKPKRTTRKRAASVDAPATEAPETAKPVEEAKPKRAPRRKTASPASPEAGEA